MKHECQSLPAAGTPSIVVQSCQPGHPLLAGPGHGYTVHLPSSRHIRGGAKKKVAGREVCFWLREEARQAGSEEDKGGFGIPILPGSNRSKIE